MADLDIQPFLDAGFVKLYTQEAWEDLQYELRISPKSTNGIYEHLYVLQRGDVSITIEANRSHVTEAGMAMDVAYPPVAVIKGPNGTTACDPTDTELVLSVAAQVG